MTADVRVIASPSSWIDGAAVVQLERTAELPGMTLAVGLPDLHPGRSSPIGAAFVASGRLYPALVGNDIGCGVALLGTTLDAMRPKREAWAKKLRGLEGPWDGDGGAWLGERGIAPSGHEAALGTIGGGNHFAELQSVERVEDEATFARLRLDREKVVLLVHSGSRGLGEEILAGHVARFGNEGLAAGTEDATRYLAQHDHALAWARANRELIAARLLERLAAQGEAVLDACHNWVEPLPASGSWLHRKGAVPATQGVVAIPGSRGAFSYLVQPRADTAGAAWSLAHGAGRKWSRSDSRARLERRHGPAELARTALGSHVICEDRDLLYEEAPQAYKDIDSVIQDLVAAGLCDVVAVLRPLVTYKVRR